MMKTAKLITALTSFVLVTGCGGGGRATTTPGIQTGSFKDSAVAGLTYATATQAGTTDSNGNFQYKDGETVTFKLYGQEIASAVAYTTLTPFDSNDPNWDIDHAINLIRFLVTIDTDADPSNGITLPVISGSFNVNFKQDIFDFATSTEVASFLTSYASGRSLITIQNAISHFNTTLTGISDSYRINFVGKTATSRAISSKCSNNFVQGWRYTFGSQSVDMVGSDTFITQNNGSICTGIGTETLNWIYATLPTGEFLDCAPSCSYAQINRITYVPSDADGRAAVISSWHTPNTNQIKSVKRIILDPANPGNPAALTKFTEILTFE